MAQRRAGLGKGLGALIQRTDEVPADTEDLVEMPEGVSYAEIPVDAISANPQQPRTVFDPEAIEELSASIKEVGLLQPIAVRRLDDSRYELIMGERRWRAAQAAGLTTIPVIIRETPDEELLREALLENLHRVQLNPLEEAAAYRQMLDDFDCSQEELSRKVQRSRPHIANTLRLLKLPSTVQRRIAAGVLTAGHARALLSLDDPAAAEKLAQRIVAEGLSVRAVEEIIAVSARTPTARRQRSVPEPSEHARQAAETLADRLDTPVTIKMGRRKGQLVIDFAAEDDLRRILTHMLDSRTSQ